MNCPVRQVELKMAERQGVEIDYCPRCRGVWLDCGELDKIIERSDIGDQSDERDHADGRYDKDYPEHERDFSRVYPAKGRRKTFMSNLFDIFD